MTSQKGCSRAENKKAQLVTRNPNILGQGVLFLSPGKPWYIINPQSNAFAWWQLVTTIALAFVVTVVPYQVGLLELEWDLLLLTSCLVDLVFLTDMVLNFFTMNPAIRDLEHL